jgi:hypothetical protein
MVQGKSGIDANNINMNVTKGERVTVETPAQQRANDNAGQGQAPVVNLRNINVTDPRDLAAVLRSKEGETEIMNVIQNNPDAIRRIMG